MKKRRQHIDYSGSSAPSLLSLLQRCNNNVAIISAATVLLVACSCTSSSHSFVANAFHTTSTTNHLSVYRDQHIKIRTYTHLFSEKRSSSSWSSSSWSIKNAKSSSRFGIRKRVRSVLERAKQRNEIKTKSKYPVDNNLSNVIADAALIGGYGTANFDELKDDFDLDLNYLPSDDLGEDEEDGELWYDTKNNNMDNSLEPGIEILDRASDEDTKNVQSFITKNQLPSTNFESVAVTTIADTTSTQINTLPNNDIINNLNDTVSKDNSNNETPKYSVTMTATTTTSPSKSVSTTDYSPSANGSSRSSLKIKTDEGKDTNKKPIEIEALSGDMSAAFSLPPPQLPFTLPKLSLEQKKQLRLGERIQFQSDMGREGSGFVVLDVAAPPNVVWECLLDFYSYPRTIPTVRDIQMFTNTHLSQDYTTEQPVEYQDGTLASLKYGVPSVTRAAFTLSKFRLKIAAIHKYKPHPLGDYMVFTLDPACTNLVLRNAKGVWHTQNNVEGLREGHTRVWLLCELKVSPILPKWIVDYAAQRAMPRATTWIKPTVEAAASLWLKQDD